MTCNLKLGKEKAVLKGKDDTGQKKEDFEKREEKYAKQARTKISAWPCQRTKIM